MSRKRPRAARWAWWTLYSNRRLWLTRNSSERMSVGEVLGPILDENESIEMG